MALGTFGAVLKFALDLEATATAFYETATTITTNQQLKNLFEKLIMQGQKRIKVIMRVRRENTTEMILEPIHGLESQPYRPPTECPEGCSDVDLLKLATTVEKKLQSFYLEAVEKISFLSEVATIFEELAEVHLQNQKLLETSG